jgi:hypothetical protein
MKIPEFDQTKSPMLIRSTNSQLRTQQTRAVPPQLTGHFAKRKGGVKLKENLCPLLTKNWF